MVAVKGSSSTGQEETENYDDVKCKILNDFLCVPNT